MRNKNKNFFYRFFENKIKIWIMSMSNNLKPYNNDLDHKSSAMVFEDNFLILYDFELSNYEKESFILVNLWRNMVLNRVGFVDKNRMGTDIFNSYIIDPNGKIFFSTKVHMNGNGKSSKLYYLNMLLFEETDDEDERMGLNFIHEEEKEILFLTLGTNDEGNFFKIIIFR